MWNRLSVRGLPWLACCLFVALGLIAYTFTPVAGSDSPSHDSRAWTRSGRVEALNTSDATPELSAADNQWGFPLASPSVLCGGRWQDVIAYSLTGYFLGDETYAAYQDPDAVLPHSFGTCGAPSNYPFDVFTIRWFVALPDSVIPITIDFQPLVFAVDNTDPLCPVPGEILCAGPTYQVEITTSGMGILTLPMEPACCIDGPFFAGVYSPTVTGPGVINLLLDQGDDVGGIGAIPCRTFNDFYDSTLIDLVDSVGFHWNLVLYAEGYPDSDTLSRCNPNECPVISGFDTDTVSAAVGAVANNTAHATDPEDDVFNYLLVSGPGTVDPLSGAWEYTPTCDDVPGFDVAVAATDREPGACSTATFHVTVTPPALTVSCSDGVVVCGDIAAQPIIASGGCPPYSYSVLSGPGAIDPSGEWSYLSDCGLAGLYVVVVEVTDNAGQEKVCGFAVNVLSGPPPTCACDCHADPQCDGVTNVLDVVHGVNVAFRGLPDIPDPNPGCPHVTTDVDCSGFTNVLDLVRLVNVAFKSADPAVEFCDPCL